MSSENNSAIIKKTQIILKELGYEVKTGHLYELFSKLSGESSWNVASVKKTSFAEKVLELMIKNKNVPEEELSLKIKNMFLNEMKESRTNEICFGFSEKNQAIITKKLTYSPNSLFVGSMGTGKSVASVVSLMSFVNNNPNHLVFVVDLLKGAMDYDAFFKLPKVYKISENYEFVNMINYLFTELMERKKALSEADAINIDDYELKTKKTLDRCLIVLEEFNYIAQSTFFKSSPKDKNSVSYKLYYILRTGRSFGVWVNIVSQRGTGSDIPSNLIPLFSNKCVFRTSKSESSFLIGKPDASDIKERGRCLTEEDGFIQFPYFNSEEIWKNIKHLMNSGINEEFLNNDSLKFIFANSLSTDAMLSNIGLFNSLSVLENKYKENGFSIVEKKKEYLVMTKNNRTIVVSFQEEIKDRTLYYLNLDLEFEAEKLQNPSEAHLYTFQKEISADSFKQAKDYRIKIFDIEAFLMNI